MGYPNPFLEGIPAREVPPEDQSDQSAGGSSEKARLIGRFLDEHCESEQTRRAYRTDLTGFFEGETSPKEAGEVGLSDIRRFLREEAENVGFQTLRRRASTLSAFFQWLKAEGLVEKSPLAEAPGPKALATRAESHATEEAVASEETSSSGKAGSGTTGTPESKDLGAPELEDGEKVRPSEGQPSQEQSSEEQSSEEKPAEEEKGLGEESFPTIEGPLLGRGPHAGRGAQADLGPAGQEVPGGENVPEREGVPDREKPAGESDDPRAVPLGEKWESKGGEPGETNSEETNPSGEGAVQEGFSVGPAKPAGDSGLSGFSPGLLSALSLLGEGPPAGLFPKDFLEVPTWAEASVKVRVARAFRFGHEAFEKGTEAKLQSLPRVIARGLSLLADRERFPEGAIQKPYYVLMSPSAEWIVTVWRTGEEASGGSRARPAASGLATRLTLAKPLMDAKKRMDEEGVAPTPHGEPYGEAARLLWLMYGRGWTLTGPLYDLLEEAIGLPFGRAEGEPERGPTKRFGAAGTKEAREEVALEVTTLLAKGLGLEKSDEVKIERIAL